MLSFFYGCFSNAPRSGFVSLFWPKISKSTGGDKTCPASIAGEPAFSVKSYSEVFTNKGSLLYVLDAKGWSKERIRLLVILVVKGCDPLLSINSSSFRLPYTMELTMAQDRGSDFRICPLELRMVLVMAKCPSWRGPKLL